MEYFPFSISILFSYQADMKLHIKAFLVVRMWMCPAVAETSHGLLGEKQISQINFCNTCIFLYNTELNGDIDWENWSTVLSSRASRKNWYLSCCSLLCKQFGGFKLLVFLSLHNCAIFATSQGKWGSRCQCSFLQYSFH